MINQYKQLISALLVLDYKLVESLISENSFNPFEEYIYDSPNEDFPKYPIVTIPIAWSWLVSNVDEWNNKEYCQEKKEKNERIIALLKKKYGIDFSNIDAKYQPGWNRIENPEDCYDCYDCYDSCEVRELLGWGIRKIDIELEQAAYSLDYQRVENLVRSGADPHVKLYDYSVLETLSSRVEIGLFELKELDNDFNQESMGRALQGLIYASWNEHMWRLIMDTYKEAKSAETIINNQ